MPIERTAEDKQKFANEMRSIALHVAENSYSTPMEMLKFNLLNLVRDHRETCNASCNVSLCLVRELAEKSGMTFTQEEKHLFI